MILLIRRGYSLLELLVCIGILTLLLGFTLPAIQKVRQNAAKTGCQSNLRQIGLGLHGYCALHGSFPAGVQTQVDPLPIAVVFPVIPWHVSLLPFIGEEALAASSSAAWAEDPAVIDSPPHFGRSVVLRIYLCPSETRTSGAHGRATTSYLGISGTRTQLGDGVLYLDSRVSMSDIRDGASHTLLVGERPPSEILGLWYGGWGHGQRGIATQLLGVREGNPGHFVRCDERSFRFRSPRTPDDPCRFYHFWSVHGEGANFLLADGSVRFLTYPSDDIMPALATRSGGEVVSVP